MPCTTLNPWRSPFAVRAVSPKSISFPSPGDADEDGSRGGQGQGPARSDAPGGRGRGEALQSRHRGRWEQWSWQLAVDNGGFSRFSQVDEFTKSYGDYGDRWGDTWEEEG